MDPGLPVEVSEAFCNLRSAHSVNALSQSFTFKLLIWPDMVAHTFTPSILRLEVLCEFEANLIYITSSGPVRAT